MKVCTTHRSHSVGCLRWMDLAILIVIIGVFVFTAPALLFVRLEPDWSLLEALYYVFISMTTIGFGDYIPGTLKFVLMLVCTFFLIIYHVR